MREKKKTLQLRKFKIANLQVHRIIGGTDDPNNPANDTRTLSEHQDSDACNSIYGTTCTVTEVKTGVNNNCTDTHQNDTTGGLGHGGGNP